MRRSRSRTSLSLSWAAVLLCVASGGAVLGGAACGKSEGGDSVTSTPTETASASASAPAPPPPPDTTPTGTGVTLTPADPATCKTAEAELAPYLVRAEIALAATADNIGALWLVQLKGKDEAQMGFATWNGDAKPVSKVRALVNTKIAPKMFAHATANGTHWTVVWFDAEGLAYVRPPKEITTRPLILRLPAVKDLKPEEMGVAPGVEGKMAVVSTFGTKGDQLSVFTFTPVESGTPEMKVSGLTKTAKRPHRPVVAADASGYTLVWSEEDGTLVANRMTPEGVEASDTSFLVAGAAKDRTNVMVVPLKSGAAVVWVEGDTILSRTLDMKGAPTSPVYRVAKGSAPSVVSADDAAYVVWLSKEAGSDGIVAAAKLVPGAAPTKGLTVTTADKPVRDAPSVAIAGGRLAVAFADAMSAVIASKRGTLRTLELGCLP